MATQSFQNAGCDLEEQWRGLLCSWLPPLQFLCFTDAQASRSTPNEMFSALLCIPYLGSFLILSVIMQCCRLVGGWGGKSKMQISCQSWVYLKLEKYSWIFILSSLVPRDTIFLSCYNISSICKCKTLRLSLPGPVFFQLNSVCAGYTGNPVARFMLTAVTLMLMKSFSLYWCSASPTPPEYSGCL